MSKTILIIDDEEDNREVLDTYLKSKGYDVLCSADGLEGLNKAREVSPDLIISDVMMPKMDGYQVCGMLKSDARYKSIPVILLTARDDASEAATSSEVMADAYINKPYEIQEVHEAVDSLLAGK